MKVRALWLLPLALLLGALGCAPLAAGESNQPAGAPSSSPASRPAGPERFQVILLHVNDVHGQTQEHLVGRQSVGGYARLATAVEEVRRTGEVKPDKHVSEDGNMAPRNGMAPVLLLHAGDEFSRGDGLTRATLGGANIQLMNAIGFDAFTPGNGEFYDGWDNLRRRARQAHFPFLMANVRSVLEPRPPPTWGVAIKQVGPVKVAILGLCFVRTELPSAWGLDVQDPIETARKLVPRLRRQADVVVALTHIGLGEDLRLAAQVGGIDVIVGGHSHTVLSQGRRQRGPDGHEVLICQAGDALRYLGRVALALRRTENGYQVTGATAELLALDQDVPQDPKIKALIARLAAATQPARQTPKTQPVR